eukprot:TRINITY_DN18520_c0_g1_i5.p1 TRINITY_DN18520_c0_g1~~TRINITY_DN18520_c0_g1_i5.p1  ORF type:complete len:887 (-),score=208.89 TRINITY_DN18520_c0_g1_i5:44-2704(-)
MAAMKRFSLRRLRQALDVVRRRWKELPSGIILFPTAGLLAVGMLGFSIHRLLLALFGRGGLIGDLAMAWLLVCFVARVILFPGSLALFRRSMEASWSVEASAIYTKRLKHLLRFLQFAAWHAESLPCDVTLASVADACGLLEDLERNLGLQLQQEVQLTKEQLQLREAARKLHEWLATLRLSRRSGQQPAEGAENETTNCQADIKQEKILDGGAADRSMSMVLWLRSERAAARMKRLYASQANRQTIKTPCPLRAVELTAGFDSHELDRMITELGDMIGFVSKPCQSEPLYMKTVRFFSQPAFCSLNQLRADLQSGFCGQPCWVPRPDGGRLDAMLLPCTRGDAAAAADVWGFPTLIYCQPNAGFMELMLHSPKLLDFYQQRGINVFLFNYSGYGRSSGRPTPAAIAADADAVLQYLRSKGVTKIGVHGRSIGGIPACHLARRHPDIVQFLVADRTMGGLASTAKHSYGHWAATGLKLSGMHADNVTNFAEARCHKVMLCDPIDHMIPDLSSLRTCVAARVVEQVAEEDRALLSEERLQKLCQTFMWFEKLFDAFHHGSELALRGESLPFLRHLQPEDAEEGVSSLPLQLKERSGSKPVAPLSPESHRTFLSRLRRRSLCGRRCQQRWSGGPSSEDVDGRWLAQHPLHVYTILQDHVDQTRAMVEALLDQFDAAGVPFGEALAGAGTGRLLVGMRSFLANLQVWGSLRIPMDGTEEEMPDPRTMDIENFTSKDIVYSDARQHDKSMQTISAEVTPDELHRHFQRHAQKQVSVLRQIFSARRCLLAEQLMDPTWGLGGSNVREPRLRLRDMARRLRQALMDNFSQIDEFLAALDRAFLRRPPDVSENQASIGYVIHVDAGHNGPLDDVDLRQLSVHLRAARFGRGFA